MLRSFVGGRCRFCSCRGLEDRGLGIGLGRGLNLLVIGMFSDFGNLFLRCFVVVFFGKLEYDYYFEDLELLLVRGFAVVVFHLERNDCYDQVS